MSLYERKESPLPEEETEGNAIQLNTLNHRMPCETNVDDKPQDDQIVKNISDDPDPLSPGGAGPESGYQGSDGGRMDIAVDGDVNPREDVRRRKITSGKRRNRGTSYKDENDVRQTGDEEEGKRESLCHIYANITPFDKTGELLL